MSEFRKSVLFKLTKKMDKYLQKKLDYKNNLLFAEILYSDCILDYCHWRMYDTLGNYVRKMASSDTLYEYLKDNKENLDRCFLNYYLKLPFKDKSNLKTICELFDSNNVDNIIIGMEMLNKLRIDYNK